MLYRNKPRGASKTIRFVPNKEENKKIGPAETKFRKSSSMKQIRDSSTTDHLNIIAQPSSGRLDTDRSVHIQSTLFPSSIPLKKNASKQSSSQIFKKFA